MALGGIILRWIVPLATVIASYLFFARVFGIGAHIIFGTVCGLIGGFIVARTSA